jgi:uncharacterized protein YecT (DUF1311 family)
MRQSFATRLFRVNIMYHFVCWTSGEIHLGQFFYRAIVKPLMLVAVCFVAWYGGLMVLGYGTMAYDWITAKTSHTSEAKPVAIAPVARPPVALEAPPVIRAAQPVAVPLISEPKPVAAPPAAAATVRESDCDADSSGPCISDRLVQADRQLNDEYRATMNRLSVDGKLSLRASERLWIKSKDATCAGFDGDEKTRCLLTETIGRTTYLQAYTGHY